MQKQVDGVGVGTRMVWKKREETRWKVSWHLRAPWGREGGWRQCRGRQGQCCAERKENMCTSSARGLVFFRCGEDEVLDTLNLGEVTVLMWEV